VGKTFATESALAQLAAEEVVLVSCAGVPNRRQLALELVEQVTGSPGSGDTTALKAVLVDELRRAFKLIVLDDAQALGPRAMALPRELFDEPAANVGFVLVGGRGAWATISAHESIRSRVFDHYEVTAMPVEQVIRVVPRFHPVWSDTRAQDIKRLDDEHCHGRFRYWNTLTVEAKLRCRRSGRAGVDEEMAQELLEWARRRPEEDDEGRTPRLRRDRRAA